MLAAKFTIRVLDENPHRRGSITWRAGQLVAAMEGCSVPSIVSALTALEHDTTPKGMGAPERWLTHFAGLESIESGKRIEPWIEIVHDGQVLRSTAEFRNLFRR